MSVTLLPGLGWNGLVGLLGDPGAIGGQAFPICPDKRSCYNR